MLTEAKLLALPAVTPSTEVSAAALLAELGQHRDLPLAFHYEGRDVRPSYHVTEVKSGHFEALDCGANFESWHETFIQLWDVAGDARDFMPVGKFLAIIGKVLDRVGLDVTAKLTFEVSDGQSAIQLYQASSVEFNDDLVRVALTRRPASCKPRDRWLDQKEATACAGSRSAAEPCCG
jgi:hypothetical protein